MKKLLVFICLMATILFGGLCAVPSSQAYAEEPAPVGIEYENDIKATLEDFLETNSVVVKNRVGRYPGSEAEANSAAYIFGKLSELSTFMPVNNITTTNGVQRFEFVSLIDGNNHGSQNIIFTKNASVTTDKKVVICAHYDSSYTEDEEPTDAVNDNAGAVALLLNLAKSLDTNNSLPFNIELVFFGAGSNDYAGSRFYSSVMDDKTAENILLTINLDRVALGTHTYMYVNEFVTSQQKFFKSVLKNQEVKQLASLKVMDLNQTSPNGLNYTHIGLESDHAIFMSRNINVLFFFSGDYENYITFGINEYEGENQITYSQDDNYANLIDKHPEFINNLAHVQTAIETILTSENFVTEMENGNGSDTWYRMWTNEKLAVFITSVLCVVFVFLYYIIYSNLQKKSRKSAGGDVGRIVLKITKNLGEDDEQITNIIDKKVKDDTDDD